MPDIRIKRVYESASRTDGFRVLVDRVWPRGLSKDDVRIKMWTKEIAPSTKLRQWFGHDPKRWPEFRKRYKAELAEPEICARIRAIVEAAGDARTITLLYGAKDTEHNQAVALCEVFRRARK